MTPDRWAEIERLYHAAAARPAGERAAFLRDACGGDDALRGEVESLLAQPVSTGGFLQGEAVALAAQLVSDPGASVLTGRRLGPYEIQARIGVGGMGEVYRAHDTKLRRDVAIKILPRHFTSDRDRLARFEREARSLASLNHPHIGAIYGLEEADGIRGLVLELVDGETLAERIARGQLPLIEALPIARQIAEALDAAHERGIVHRDLKPANIKITPDGVVKVLDFGLAKAVTGDAPGRDLTQSPTVTVGGTREGVVLGTAAYMSPEQARGKPVDKRTDIWAFGCVLFEMLTGHAAFPGETVSDTIGAILHSEPAWATLPPSVPVRVRELLKRCFEKDARLRLRDIGDARYELDARTEPVGPRSDDAVPTPNPRLAWLLAAMAILLAVTAVGWTMRTSREVNSTAPIASRAISITNTPDPEFGPAISPDGKWVAYYANNNGRSDLLVKFLENGSTLNLTRTFNMELPTRAGIGGISISPDGSLIAFSARPDPSFGSYDTWIVPGPVGGSPRKLLPTIGSVQWSPDGKQLTYTIAGSTGGDGLGVSSSDGTGQRVLVPREGGRHIHWPAWSRDGKYIYFIYTYDSWHGEPAETWRVAVAGGKPQPVVKTVRRAIYPAPLPSGDLLFAGNLDSLDLGLWWQPASGGSPVAITNGIGEHTEVRVTPDGRRAVATLLQMRRSLLSIPVTGDKTGWRQLTDGYSGDQMPTVDFRSGRMVFSSSRSGHRNLWAAKADASDAIPLTTEAAIDDRPAFSRDGQQIAFVSDRGGERGIWMMNAQGGAPKLLAREVALDQLSWSPNSERVFFSRPGGDLPSLASVNVADGRVEPVRSGGSVAPAWSPTDDVLAFIEVTMVAAPPPSTGTVARLFVKFVDPQGNALYPKLPARSFSNPLTAWSPDGRKLGVLSIPANGPAEIWIVEPKGGDPVKKLVDLPAGTRPSGITWSKEGDRVIVANQEYQGDIVMYELTHAK